MIDLVNKNLRISRSVKVTKPLTFIGCGSSRTPTLGNTSAYFIIDDILCLFDCGYDVWYKLLQSGILDQVSRCILCLSHRHEDHIGSIGGLLWHFHAVKKNKCTIVTKERELLETYLKCTGVPDDIYKTESKYLEHNLAILPHLTHHTELMNNTSFIVMTPACAFYYSGDADEISKDNIRLFLTGQIDFIYHSLRLTKGEGHLDLDFLIKQIPKRKRERVCAMHFTSMREIALIEDRGFDIATNYLIQPD